VLAAHPRRLGQAVIDRRLYPPRAWAGGANCQAKAHPPEEMAFARKIEMTRGMIAAALEVGASPLGSRGCAAWRAIMLLPCR